MYLPWHRCEVIQTAKPSWRTKGWKEGMPRAAHNLAQDIALECNHLTLYRPNCYRCCLPYLLLDDDTRTTRHERHTCTFSHRALFRSLKFFVWMENGYIYIYIYREFLAERVDGSEKSSLKVAFQTCFLDWNFRKESMRGFFFSIVRPEKRGRMGNLWVKIFIFLVR